MATSKITLYIHAIYVILTVPHAKTPMTIAILARLLLDGIVTAATYPVSLDFSSKLSTTCPTAHPVGTNASLALLGIPASPVL